MRTLAFLILALMLSAFQGLCQTVVQSAHGNCGGNGAACTGGGDALTITFASNIAANHLLFCTANAVVAANSTVSFSTTAGDSFVSDRYNSIFDGHVAQTSHTCAAVGGVNKVTVTYSASASIAMACVEASDLPSSSCAESSNITAGCAGGCGNSVTAGSVTVPTGHNDLLISDLVRMNGGTDTPTSSPYTLGPSDISTNCPGACNFAVTAAIAYEKASAGSYTNTFSWSAGASDFGASNFAFGNTTLGSHVRHWSDLY